MRINSIPPRFCAYCGAGPLVLHRPSDPKRYCSISCSRRDHPTPKTPPSQLFWAHVHRGSGTDSGACWLWTGSRNPKGYGHFGLGGQCTQAHRAAWILTNGAIPDGLCVLHKCDNPPCVRPDHLFLGTNADNMADMVSKGRAAQRDNSNYPRGENHPNAKLTDSAVLEIRARYAAGEMGTYRLASLYHVAQMTIHGIVTRKHWRHI